MACFLAELRDNAASNVARMSVGPDGHWVALAGGGGWRPIEHRAEGGYGVAVFSAWNLEHWQGFFATDAYPLGVCFNPVTGQVAAIREQDASVYHMADPKGPSRLGGPFSGPAAWSGDGRYLFLARKDKGLACWSNALSDAETQIAGTWWKGLKIAEPAAAPLQPPAFRIVAAVQGFGLAEPKRDEIARELAQALAAGDAAKPPAWRLYPPYLKDDEMRRVVQQAEQSLRAKEDFGITIYQVKKALQTYPDCAPLKYTLAEALRQGSQPEEAERYYLEAIRGDAGRTALSCRSLDQLASLLASQGRDLAALHCLTTSLSLDRADPRTLQATAELLKKLNLAGEAEQLAKLRAELPTLGSDRPAPLPRLPRPAAATTRPSAGELYRTSAACVVLVQAGDASGSGVCIGAPDTILTNHHVIARSDNIGVVPFAFRGDALVRRPRRRASVIFQSEKDDLAVLKVEDGPPDLRPMPVADRNPAVGERIYAIGNPGLGGEILDQTVTEGIISAAGRVINGATYLQHSAAINPGNSGGPLIDEWGRLVGVVTLKSDLPGVGFAIPVATVRAAFRSP
jgi:S1-C subfamily serine protease